MKRLPRIPITKKFGHRTYLKVADHPTKSSIEHAAKHWKKGGFYTRIVMFPSTKPKDRYDKRTYVLYAVVKEK
jgi:hypothetical protein